MSTRSTRRPATLNSIESLLLAQSVWDLGASHSTWAPIARILSKHPLLSRPKSFFTAQSCHSMYETLMKDAELEMDESTTVPHASVNLQLAQKHYHSRFLELQGLILNEETKFKAVLKEIEDIRAGLSDKQDSKTITRAESPSQLLSQPLPPQTQVADEIFSGSDLSGVTESAESNPSQSQPENEAQNSPIQVDQDAQDVPMEDIATPFAGKPEILEELPSDGGPLPSTPKHHIQDLQDEVSEAISATPKPEQAAPENLPPADTMPTSGHQSPSSNPEEECSNADLAGKDDEMEGPEPVDTSNAMEDEDLSNHGERLDKKQEEEEDEITQEEKNEEEEEEASQGHEESEMLEEEKSEQKQEDEVNVLQEDEDKEMDDLSGGNIQVDIEQIAEEEPSSPKSIQDNNIESDLEPEPAHSPVAETVGSEAEPTPDDGQSSEMEEPVAPARRSSRRRKSSAASVPPPPQTRTRLRSKARASETGLHTTTAIDSDNDGDLDAQEDTPQIASSPYDGAMTRRRDGKRKASFLESAGSPHDKKRLREDSEPVDEEEPGPSSHNLRARISRHGTRTEEQVAMKRFQSVIGMLHSQISQHRNGNIFHNPIKNSEAPDYHEIVKRPMDLKTIKTRVKDGVIANSLEFQRDIYLMFANAMMYNRPGSDVHAMAEDMMLESEGQINAFRQTEGLVKRGQRP